MMKRNNLKSSHSIGHRYPVRLAIWLFGLFGLFAMVSPPALARGLAFTEQMHGYAYVQGEFRNVAVYFNVVIGDIDAWRVNPNVAASLSGTLVADRLPNAAVTGTLRILAAAPGRDGRLLNYQFTGGGLQFFGVKHVHDDKRLDLVDDMTTLRGALVPSGQGLPTLDDLLYRGQWSSELHFEWWKPAVVWDFSNSFRTLATPWYQDLQVKLLFLQTVFGYLVHEYFPWFG